MGAQHAAVNVTYCLDDYDNDKTRRRSLIVVLVVLYHEKRQSNFSAAVAAHQASMWAGRTSVFTFQRPAVTYTIQASNCPTVGQSDSPTASQAYGPKALQSDNPTVP